MSSTPRARADTPAQIVAVTRYSFSNYLRSRRFLVMSLIVALISLALTVIVAYDKPAALLSSTDAFYGGWWGTFVGPFLILIVVFFGGDAVSGEFQNKTGFFLVPLPIRRSTIYVGKLVAALITSSLILALFFAFTVANGVYYFGSGVPHIFLESTLFAWIVLVSALSFTFMFSSLFKSAVVSVMLTIIMILIVFNILQGVSTGLLHIEPWFLLSYGVQIVNNVLMVPYPPHYSSAPVPYTWNPTIPEGLAILGGYFLVCGVLGLVMFERKEFN